jgi:ribosomal protein S18 acetylase RimI-like enzyme
MITYRNMIADDYDRIEQIEEDRGAMDSFCVEELEEMFNNDENNFATYNALVALDGDSIVGYLVSFTLVQFPKRSAIIRCYVDHDYRRQGIGSELIKRVEPTKSGYRVSIEVGEVDYASAAFLRANGYTVTEVVDAEYNEEGELELEGYMILQNEKKPKMSLTQRLTWRAN